MVRCHIGRLVVVAAAAAVQPAAVQPQDSSNSATASNVAKGYRGCH